MDDSRLAIKLLQLPHQEAALDAILDEISKSASAVLAETAGEKITNACVNPQLPRLDNIDVKMETGTGKTYVYTRLLYALHQRFGLFKFIIVVPSIAIKEGTKNFMESSYAQEHFQRFYPGKKLSLQLINAGDFVTKNGRRKTFPNALVQYVEATRSEQNNIHCLLLNTALLDKDRGKIYDDDFDQTLFDNETRPAEAIKRTRPIVIIDEPHRVKPGDKAFENIKARFNPQLIIRFGATFPETGGVAQYFRNKPVYELGAVPAFNQGLVKAIDVVYPDIPGVTDPASALKFEVAEINSSGGTKSVTFKRVGRSAAGAAQRITLHAGDPLSMLDKAFEGDVTLDVIKSKTKASLSNEVELGIGRQFFADTFLSRYQETLLQQAIEAHFEKETENFFRPNSGVNPPKIKTISLFFIDSISSYRDSDGWLKTTFEKLLTAKLDCLIAKYKDLRASASPREKEFLEYLQATRQNIAGAHGGYFAKDWGEPDGSAVVEEREDILHKERTLTFKRPDGSWNTRRFFFSKWTLREGWDNPNVFVITKMRTSGSETSKLQEVGRGLRLPVDERGNRLSEEEFRLTYLIDYSEAGFARKLVGEINSDAPVQIDKTKVTEKTIKLILQTQLPPEEFKKIENDTAAFSEKSDEVLTKLDNLDIIKRDNFFKEGGYAKLLEIYPTLLDTLRKNKVTERPAGKKPVLQKVKLRLQNWEKIRDFWAKVTKRYMLEFERLEAGELETLLDNVLGTLKN
ncbi:MAG: type III restriction-modification system endonuclease [Opitutaceae bacterium]|jgi:type III restriction enzyme|nr:type III restriction-modification system endonuclease [Opitutaceae bacterium]